ncbi:MAG: hypothetical protein IJR09_01985 [Paludibacteraceae bacterium]|nr:hypothetical protein [Paludibacteraceae bacterium]MBR0064921.1 hypothetical protein [Paludibacteraceae bacterium]
MKKIYTQPRTETVATTPQQILCASGGIKAQISGYKQNTGGGFTQTFAWLAGAVCSSLLFLGTACSTNNTPDQPKQQAELKPRMLIVTEVESQKSKVERRLPQATITENGDVLGALWNAGDAVFYRNLSRNEYTDPQEGSVDLFGTLRADKEGSVASFSGDRVWCTEDDQLALIYPAPDPADFTFHDDPLTAEYTISVAGQDGTLATLAKDFHHIYGIASVVSVTGTTANAELAQMKSLLTVCKFSFVDKDAPGTPLPISSLKISLGGTGLYTGTYPQQGTVSIAQSTPAWDVSVDPEWEITGGKPLTIDTKGVNPTEVYVALFPDDGATYSFTVTSATGNATDGTYTGTATATLNEGEFVPATGLRLVKQ